jgi:hypothetical protein
MPKAILEFNLPEETEAHEDALDGTALRGAAQDFSNYLRSIRKYGELTQRIEKRFYEDFSDLVWK